MQDYALHKNKTKVLVYYLLHYGCFQQLSSEILNIPDRRKKSGVIWKVHLDFRTMFVKFLHSLLQVQKVQAKCYTNGLKLIRFIQNGTKIIKIQAKIRLSERKYITNMDRKSRWSFQISPDFFLRSGMIKISLESRWKQP